MQSILSDTAFSHTTCTSPTISPIGSFCIISLCLTTRINPSTQSAEICGSMYCVGIAAAYSWIWRCNIHCYVFVNLWEMVNIGILAGISSRNWRIWSRWVQLKYNAGKEQTRPRKVFLRSRCVYWTHMLWDSVTIHSLASVDIRLQIQSQTLNWWSGVKWLTIVRQPIQKLNQFIVK
jgi:hypothetical protein